MEWDPDRNGLLDAAEESVCEKVWNHLHYNGIFVLYRSGVISD